MATIRLRELGIDFPVMPGQTSLLQSVTRKMFGEKDSSLHVVHALQDISLEIHDGERVGLIGHNGAGKTTLLKVLAGIYPPVHGEAHVEGRVCPLFEFATGFEMIATGWDNIRTRALLLGMSSREIREKIKEIGEFSGLGRFLDLPVRCYSSGMFLRLAFSVSTAIDPSVLLLDEVMAAGDANFIARAQARMNNMVDRAAITLMASHSLGFLNNFCARTIWLDHGRIMRDGPTAEVVRAYQESAAIAA
jgi:ABC-type polysaccharide/polyol phosphate transport system ATPase subunit